MANGLLSQEETARIKNQFDAINNWRESQTQGNNKAAQTFTSPGFKSQTTSWGQDTQPIDDEVFLKNMRLLGQSRMKAGPVVPDVITPMEAWYQKRHREGGGEIYEREFSQDPEEIKIAEQEGWPHGSVGARAATRYYDSSGYIPGGKPIISLNTEFEGDMSGIFRHEGPGHIVFESLRNMGELDKIPFPEGKGFVEDSVRLLVNAGYEDEEIDVILGESLLKLNDADWDWTVRDLYDMLQSNRERWEMIHGSAVVTNWPLAMEHGLVNALARDPTLVENVVGWDDPSTQTAEGFNPRYMGKVMGPTERTSFTEMKRGNLGEFETPISKQGRTPYSDESVEEYDERMKNMGSNDPVSYALLQGRYGERAIKKINNHIKENMLKRDGWLEEMAWYQDNVGSY